MKCYWSQEIVLCTYLSLFFEFAHWPRRLCDSDLSGLKLSVNNCWPMLSIFIMAHANFPFPLTLGKLETQTLGGSIIRSFALGHVLGELEPFFQFFIMTNAIFLFPLTLGQLETQTLGEGGSWEFCSRTRFGGARAIFPIFHNDQCHFFVSVDTWTTGDPNFRGGG